MSIGYNRPLYVLPFDHRGSFQTKMFGWKGTLTPEQTAEAAATKRVDRRRKHGGCRAHGFRHRVSSFHASLSGKSGRRKWRAGRTGDAGALGRSRGGDARGGEAPAGGRPDRDSRPARPLPLDRVGVAPCVDCAPCVGRRFDGHERAGLRGGPRLSQPV